MRGQHHPREAAAAARPLRRDQPGARAQCPQERSVTAVPMLQTTELLQVECLPGFDGGLDQVAVNQPSQSFTVPGEGPSDQTAHLI